MSWWVYLQDAESGHPVTVSKHSEGGTHVLGGCNDAELNITYNYGGLFRSVGLVFKEYGGNVHGQKAKDMIPRLEEAVKILGIIPSNDYWSASPGNAGHTLNILLTWARQYPEAVFEVH
jgi:hypothetical protein